MAHYDDERERELAKRIEGMDLNNQKRFLLKTITLTNCTLGKMYLITPTCTDEFLPRGGVKKEYLFSTLENPWLGNTPYISCVPAGDYFIKPYISQRHGACYYLESVDQTDTTKNVGLYNGSRTECVIHSANKPSEMVGGIAVGQYNGVVEGEIAIMNSIKTMRDFYQILDGFDYQLTIERF